MNYVERVINGYTLKEEEALQILHTPDHQVLILLNDGYQVRYHYYQNKVKLNMFLNAKSGLCAEDCGYCGQSIKVDKNETGSTPYCYSR